MDFSDNELTDNQSQIVCDFIKLQAELRDQQLWEVSLRARQIEQHLKQKIKAYNKNYADVINNNLPSQQKSSPSKLRQQSQPRSRQHSPEDQRTFTNLKPGYILK